MAEQELILDRYRIVGRAGAGGYATVQHAFDTHLKRDVAIKCIKINPAELPSPESMRRAAIARQQSGEEAYVKGAIKTGASMRDLPLPGEPTFLSTRDKMAEARSKRKRLPFLKATANDVKAMSGASEERSAQQSSATVVHSTTRSAGLIKQPRGEYHPIDNEIAIPAFIRAKDGGKSNNPRRGRIDPYERKAELEEQARRNAMRANGASGGSGYESAEIVRLADVLPGRIGGVGEAEISSIGDAPLELSALPVTSADTAPSLETTPSGTPLPAEGQDGPAFSIALNHPGLHPPENLKPFAEFTGYDARSQSHGASGSHNSRHVASSDYSGSFAPFSAEPLPDILTFDNIPGLEEARTAAHLNDMNIVTVYDCEISGEYAYVIMEYVEGKTLAKLLRELENDITLDMVSYVFASVSHALEVAHDAGVLHLDIKPENVIVNKDGVVKVTDFGLSALMDAGGLGTTGGGTIGYMPLEQMRQQALDVRTDEWALASLSYEMLSGKNPFKARNLQEAEIAIEDAELVIPSLCWEDIDPGVDDVVFAALAPDKDMRYESVKDFAEDLQPMLGDSKAGRKQLASAVKNEYKEALPKPEHPKEKAPKLPATPIIDKIGPKGSSWVMRIFAALGALAMGAFSCLNFRAVFSNGGVASSTEGFLGGASEALPTAQFDASTLASHDTAIGLFGTMPVAAWCILGALALISLIRPRWAFPAAYTVLAITMIFNQAWLCAILLVGIAGAWWWFIGRANDVSCTLALMQPLLGSVGFTAAIPVISGAIQDVRDAAWTCAMVIASAFLFSSFGSANVMNWEVYTNFVVAVNPSIAGTFMTDTFIGSIGNLGNWCMAASWILGAIAYSALCRKGTRGFDILGSVVCGVCVIAGTFVMPMVTASVMYMEPLVIIGTIASAFLGVALAAMNVTDRVRMADGEW